MAVEAKLQARTTAFAKSQGIETIRLVFRPGVARGWPDALFLVPGGKPVFIEFKAPGRRPTPLQEHRLGALRAAGYDVHVADNFDAARKALTRALERARLSA